MDTVYEAVGTPAGAAVKSRPELLVAIGDYLKNALVRIATSPERARQRDLERYLATSTDVVELESRLRDLQRGAFFSRYS